MGGIGQNHQQATIVTLPDDVLLKIFKFFVNETYCYHNATEEWRTLVHMCRRWRTLAFASPRHLNLQLLCTPPSRSVKDMLDIWPELPIYVYDVGYPLKEARDDVVAALRLNHRVSGIRLHKTSDSEWETFAPLTQHPFPVLTHLWVQSCISIKKNKDVIPRSFLGGSAPCLRSLRLVYVPFPTLPELLSSATNLVRLWYDNIPPSGYISPQEMVTGLSALTCLESLSLTFRSPQSLAERSIRIPPPRSHTLLPALTYIGFLGTPEYMEDLLAQIDTPLLENVNIGLFDQEVLEVSELAKFVYRTDKLSSLNQAEVTFRSDYISITLSPVMVTDPKTFILNLTCPEFALRLSYVARFCASCLPDLSPFEFLHIIVPFHHTWQNVINNSDPQWLDLLCLFNSVKDLHLSRRVAPHVAQALRELPVERVMKLLPALEKVFIPDLKHSGPVSDAISGFAEVRQLSGHPVFIYDLEREVYYRK